MGSGPRILAITESASLVVGLTFWPADWEVASQPTPEDVGDADLLVVDLDSTATGVAALRRCRADGVSCPVVVIGNEPGDGQLTGDVSLLLRPYSLNDLAERIDQLLRGRQIAMPASPAADEPNDDLAEVAIPNGSSPAEDADVAPPSSDPIPSSEAREDEEAAAGVRTVERLFGRLAGRTPPARSDDSSAVDEADADPGTGDDADAQDPDVVLDLTELEPREGGPSGRRSGGTRDPAAGSPTAGTPAAPAPTVTSPRPLTDALAAAQRGSSPIPAAGASAVEAAPRPSRWFARKQRRVSAAEQDLRERLVRVLAATSELERLIDEVPLLADLPALAAVVVDDLATRLRADTVGLWRYGDRGWTATAQRGLTRHEATWVVPDDQPMFAEVHRTGGSLLIDPVEPVQAAIAGIGGAHTESFMATSIAVGPGRYGILAVGRDDPLTADDLDTLAEVALEVAPGLAVAEQIERLRATARPPEPAPPPKRSWHR